MLAASWMYLCHNEYAIKQYVNSFTWFEEGERERESRKNVKQEKTLNCLSRPQNNIEPPGRISIINF